MNLPSLLKGTSVLKQSGDFIKLRRTSTNRIVATAKSGDVKMSQTIYPTTGRVVETRSYSIKDG